MRVFVRILIIAALAVMVALGWYALVKAEFSMDFASGNIGPGFPLLIMARAAVNGGQVAPSFDEMQSAGELPPFMQGAGGGPFGSAGEGTGGAGFGGRFRRQPAALTKGFSPQGAARLAAKDLLLLAFAALIAALVELPLYWAASRRRQAASA